MSTISACSFSKTTSKNSFSQKVSVFAGTDWIENERCGLAFAK
jgi:hypothetical protein